MLYVYAKWLGRSSVAPSIALTTVGDDLRNFLISVNMSPLPLTHMHLVACSFSICLPYFCTSEFAGDRHSEFVSLSYGREGTKSNH